MATLAQMLGNRKKNQDIGDILHTALFGAKKKPAKKTTPAPVKMTSTVDESQVALLRSIAANARISAKNSMALPSILQQTNIMQKNIAKLVRIQGASPSNKADAFFSNAKFREGAYEASYRKNLGGTSPKPVSSETNQNKTTMLGFMGSIFSMFKGLFGPNLVKTLIGGVLLAGLIKYFKDGDFQQKVDSILISVRDAIFSTKGWMTFKQGVADVGTALILLVGALATFKLAMAALSGWMFAQSARQVMGGCCGGGPMGGPARKPGRGPKGGSWGSKIGRFLRNPRTIVGGALVATAAYGAGELQNWADAPPEGASTGASPQGSSPNMQSPEPANKKTNWGSVVANSVGGVFAAQGAITASRGVAARGMTAMRTTGASKKIVGRWISMITKFRTRGWGPRLISKLSIKLSRSVLGKKILKRAVAFIAGLFLPGPGWISSLLMGAFLIWDLLWLIDIVSNIYTELESEDAQQTQATSAAKGKDGETTSSAPAKTQSDTGSKWYDSWSKALSVAAPALAAASPVASVVGSGLSMGKDLATKLSGNVPEGMFKDVNFAQVKERIIQGEGTGKQGRNPYETVYGFGQYGTPPKNLTDMSIGEVQTFQDKLRNATKGKVKGVGGKGTSAVGAYQFVSGTLKDLAKKVYGDQWQSIKFTPEVQDRLAQELFDSSKASNKTLSAQWAAFANIDKEGGAALRAQGATGIFNPPLPTTTPSTPSQPAVVPMRNASAIKPSSSNAPSYMMVDNSTQVVNSPASGGASVQQPAMPSIYNPEQHQLSYLMRTAAY